MSICTPVIITSEAIYTVWWINMLYLHLHFVYAERISERADSASERTHSTTKLHCFSDDSSEHLWLAIAFIKSTESCVIGYNTQHCKTWKKKYDITNNPYYYLNSITSLIMIIIIIVKGISPRQYLWLLSIHNTIVYWHNPRMYALINKW